MSKQAGDFRPAPADAEDLLRQILPRLDRSGAPDARFPDRRGEYWALCPFHADTHPENFSVSGAGYKCFACGAAGGLVALAEKLGAAGLQGCTVDGGDITPPSPPL